MSGPYLDPTDVAGLIAIDLPDCVAPADLPGFGNLMDAIEAFNAAQDARADRPPRFGSVSVASTRGTMRVVALHTGRFFAVTPCFYRPLFWRVTHLASGFACPGAFADIEAAVTAVRVLDRLDGAARLQVWETRKWAERHRVALDAAFAEAAHE